MVPIVTVAALAAVPRIPVRWISRTVGTSVPVPSSEVTLNGSSWQGNGAGVLVMLQMVARPPGPGGGGVMKMSGCALTMTTSPRITVPLLFMTIG